MRDKVTKQYQDWLSGKFGPVLFDLSTESGRQGLADFERRRQPRFKLILNGDELVVACCPELSKPEWPQLRLMAATRYEKNTVICEYTGHHERRVPYAKTFGNYVFSVAKESITAFSVRNSTPDELNIKRDRYTVFNTINAEMVGGVARYANTTQTGGQANAHFVSRGYAVFIVANKTIRPGEEVMVFYADGSHYAPLSPTTLFTMACDFLQVMSLEELAIIHAAFLKDERIGKWSTAEVKLEAYVRGLSAKEKVVQPELNRTEVFDVAAFQRLFENTSLCRNNSVATAKRLRSVTANGDSQPLVDNQNVMAATTTTIVSSPSVASTTELGDAAYFSALSEFLEQYIAASVHSHIIEFDGLIQAELYHEIHNQVICFLIASAHQQRLVYEGQVATSLVNTLTSKQQQALLCSRESQQILPHLPVLLEVTLVQFQLMLCYLEARVSVFVSSIDLEEQPATFPEQLLTEASKIMMVMLRYSFTAIPANYMELYNGLTTVEQQQLLAHPRFQVWQNTQGILFEQALRWNLSRLRSHAEVASANTVTFSASCSP